ncbi:MULTISPECIES: DUF481 domain-containing protein [Prochlorococcus]|uniref:Salt-induced outer membrane prototein-like protein n=1 Tax=Prochlorococcus marinus (strain SARG / CCMP1375 / SS120) TaxID=167539 RepID=Q7VAD5_PROMA|nr:MULTISPECIES: DUF481 domain-containing protein [Prochlorococcus]AAQ00573.1 salt-induced outer membrane prototein-like protein [Prochlorococcus marinus subsp. marinus str. CCMP1375]KGG10940.1 hypothetical protein EV04_1904 [Prochlorococcus marinus str. LG]KGG20524.1 hypothetical protein EV08_1110 [Prochlorococcus marinus str. SS2]KGG24189.1 hypothetical protein EV09_0796 [Prochlorococcus marinus str. SS35]KGG31553.1 hypothetical protein EV10_1646 [Prochlorococcus marinus str. SS51]
MKALCLLSLLLGFSSAIPVPTVRAGETSYKLRNGDIITGELLEELSSEEVKVIQHPYLGKLKIRVSSIYIEPKVKPWQTSIDFGFNGIKTGGNDSFDYSLDGNTIYFSGDNRFKINASLERQQNNNQATSNKRKVDIRYDKIRNEKFSLFAYSRYKYNELNTIGINENITSIGVSKKLINTDKQKLSLSLGPGINWYGGGELCSTDPDCESFIPATFFSSEYQWNISKKISFEIEDIVSTAFSSKTKVGNYFSTTFKFYPFQDSSFHTSIKYEINYDSEIEPNTDRAYKFLMGVSF